MNASLFVLAIMVLPIRLASAQSGSTTSSGTPTNRQQELYDQYHGINKKASTTKSTNANKTTTTNSPATKSTSAPVPKKTETIVSQPTAPAPPTVVTKAPRSSTVESVPGGGPAPVRIGVRGGVTYPAYLETPTGVTPDLGFVGGISFTFGSGHVSFQPEINYARYAYKQSTTVLTQTITKTYATDVLEIPLLVKFSSGNYYGHRVFLNVGPYVNYWLSNSIDGKTSSLEGVSGRLGFGAAAGIGVALRAGPGHLTIEARGLYSLGNTDTGFNTDSKTIATQGTLGYIVPLGGR